MEGRSDVRAMLYMGTLAAVRLNPSLHSFHGSIRRVWKSSKMALTACMRKLVVMLNAMVKAGNWYPTERVRPLKRIAAGVLT